MKNKSFQDKHLHMISLRRLSFFNPVDDIGNLHFLRKEVKKLSLRRYEIKDYRVVY